MNESIFIIHILIVAAFGYAALKMGKETLVSWICIQAVLANLFVIKQINFFGFEVTCSDVFAIGSILGLNLLQEYFGKEISKKAIWICFFVLAFFGVMSKIHLIYEPSLNDVTQASFKTLLAPTPRLLLASVFVFLFVQQLDRRFFTYLKEKSKLPLILRNNISLLISQLIDTVMFSFLGLYGQVSSLFDIIVVSFLLKAAIILTLSFIRMEKHAART